MNKRGLSDIIVTVLIILVALAAIVLVWVFIRSAIEESAVSIEGGAFGAVMSYALKISPESVFINQTGRFGRVVVRRESSGGEMIGLILVLYDPEKNSESMRWNGTLAQFQTVLIEFNYTKINYASVLEVVPVYLSSSGKEILGNVADKYIIPFLNPVAAEVNACENGSIDASQGEQCEGINFNGKQCRDLPGFSGGNLACWNKTYELGKRCTFNTATCTPAATVICGNAVINPGEQCDKGAAVNGIACNAPYGGSCVYCNQNCSNRTVAGPRCGDWYLNSTYEECDRFIIGALYRAGKGNCTDFGFAGGTVSCTSECVVNISSCVNCDSPCSANECVGTNQFRQCLSRPGCSQLQLGPIQNCGAGMSCSGAGQCTSPGSCRQNDPGLSSCAELNYNSCNLIAGCNWYSDSHCSGSVSATSCTEISDLQACSAISACYWEESVCYGSLSGGCSSLSLDQCSNTNDNCLPNYDSGQCEDNYGGLESCSDLSPGEVCSALGCNSGPLCNGPLYSSDCSAFGSDSCSQIPGCSWNLGEYCGGSISGNCEEITNREICTGETSNRCTWY